MIQAAGKPAVQVRAIKVARVQVRGTVQCLKSFSSEFEKIDMSHGLADAL